jgi:hypothetical protein
MFSTVWLLMVCDESVDIPVSAQDAVHHHRNPREEQQGVSPPCRSGHANRKESNTGAWQHNQPGSTQNSRGEKKALSGEPLKC